jgi:hypothetical protein
MPQSTLSVSATGREPAFLGEHDWLQRAAFPVVTSTRPLNHPDVPVWPIQVLCNKSSTQNEGTAETVMLTVPARWRPRIAEAIDFAQGKFDHPRWYEEPYLMSSTHLGTLIAQAVVGNFAPTNSSPSPDSIRDCLQAPLATVVRAARLIRDNPIIGEFIGEVGPALTISADDLLDRAVQLTQPTV